jgi:hypothetical protein
MKTKILGKAKVSKNMTIAIIVPLRPHLQVKRGDYIQFVECPDGTIRIEKTDQRGES